MLSKYHTRIRTMKPPARGAATARRTATHTEPLERRALLSAGQLDPTFGWGDGIVAHPDAGIDVSPMDLAATPDGKLVALGDDVNPNGSLDFLVARYNADGTLDTTFGAGGYQTTDFGGTRDDAAAVVVQDDGKVVVAGTTGPAPGGGHALLALARYNTDGSLDTTFDGDGRATLDITPATASVFVEALAAAPGGKFVVLASSYDPTPSSSQTLVARLNPDGSRDATFDGDGVATVVYQGGPAPATTLGVAPDGKVVLAGVTSFDPNPVGTSGNLAVTKLNADGSPDTTFSADGTAVLHDPDATLTDYPRGIAFAGGKVLIAYETEGNVGGAAAFDPGALRLNSDGTLDTTFGDGGYRKVVVPGINDVAGFVVRPDGKLLIGVSGDTSFGQPTNQVVRLTPDGSVDTTFGGGDGIGDLQYADAYHGGLRDTVLLPSGRIVTLAWGRNGLQSRFALAALTPDGQNDPAFRFTNEPADPQGFIGRFRDTAVLPGGKILAVGNTLTGAYLARLNSDGSFDATFGGGDGRVFLEIGPAAGFGRVAVQADGKIVAFGAALARFNDDGSLDATFGGGDGLLTPSAPGEGLALQPDGKILTAEGNPRDGARVARYNTDGSVDTTFGGGGSVTFNFPIGKAPWDEEGGPYDGFVPLDVAWQASSGKIIVGGQSPGFGTITDFAAVRINPDGSVDATFGNGTGLVSYDTQDWDIGGRIDVAPDGAIAMAGEEEDEDPHVVLFDNDGNWAKSVRLPWIGDTADVAFTPDGRIVVTGDAEGYDFESDGEHSDVRVIRLNRDLTVDTTFGGAEGARTDAFGSSDDVPYGVTVGPDGAVLVAGSTNSSPLVLRYDGGGLPPTAVAQTFFGSTAWGASFLRHVDRFFGDDRYGVGFAAPSGPSAAGEPATPAPLPWLNLDRVGIRFNRPVTVERGDLHVRGVNVEEYGIRDFRYDPATRTAVWTLDRPIGADKLLLQLDNVEGLASAFRSRVDVLPGDVTRDGTVVADDYSQVKQRFFKSANDTAFSQTPYSIYHDVDGSGVIVANDYSEVKQRFFTRLPAGGPGAATAPSSVAPAPDPLRPVRSELFGTEPIPV